MKRSGGVGASAGERGAAIGRKEKDNAEDTEFAEKRNPRVRRRGGVALERRSPPFAKGAKDGAASSWGEPKSGAPGEQNAMILRTWGAGVLRPYKVRKAPRFRKRPLQKPVQTQEPT